MSKRSALRAAILQDTQAVTMIPADRWFQRGAVGPDAPDRPFAIIAAVGPALQPGSRPRYRAEDFEIWVHDEPGSYTLVDSVIATVAETLENTVQFTFNGFRIAQISIQGIGPDLNDDVLRTVTRSLRVRVSGEAV